MGMVWLPIGISTENYALFIMGLVFIALGLANKKKWKKNRRTWSQLTKKEKKFMMIIIGALVLLLIIGVLAFFLFQP